MLKSFLFLLITFITITACKKFDPLEPMSSEKVVKIVEKAQNKYKVDFKNVQCEPISEQGIQKILQNVQKTEAVQVRKKEVAVLVTNYGVIVIAFFAEKAPEHTKSFKRLVNAGFFDCVRFHRVVDGYMIQGGDILTRDDYPDNDGTGNPGYLLSAEFNDVPHDLGIVSMARAQQPNTAGSQFFICLSRERTKMLDRQYTVFGKVIGGLDTVLKIGKVETTFDRNGEKSVPVEPVTIKKAFMALR